MTRSEGEGRHHSRTCACNAAPSWSVVRAAVVAATAQVLFLLEDALDSDFTFIQGSRATPRSLRHPIPSPMIAVACLPSV